MKKTPIKLILLSALYLGSIQTKAQQKSNTDLFSLNMANHQIQAKIQEKESIQQVVSDSSQGNTKAGGLVNDKITFSNNWGASIGAGTLGFGATVNKKISNHFTVNLGYYQGNLNQNAETTFGKDQVSIDANIKVGAAVLLFDYHPSVKSSFRFTFGAAYNFNNYDVDITPKGEQSYGLIIYKTDQVGKITFDITGANVAPYLGIGFGNAVPKGRVGVGFDIGAFYHGEPKTKLITTGSFEPSNTPENRELLQNAFKGYAFYPFVNLKLNIKLIK
jgi:hypothetical protein